jgi:hypothetical protein
MRWRAIAAKSADKSATTDQQKTATTIPSRFHGKITRPELSTKWAEWNSSFGSGPASSAFGGNLGGRIITGQSVESLRRSRGTCAQHEGDEYSRLIGIPYARTAMNHPDGDCFPHSGNFGCSKEYRTPTAATVGRPLIAVPGRPRNSPIVPPRRTDRPALRLCMGALRSGRLAGQRREWPDSQRHVRSVRVVRTLDVGKRPRLAATAGPQ